MHLVKVDSTDPLSKFILDPGFQAPHRVSSQVKSSAWVPQLATCALPKGVCYLLTYLQVKSSLASRAHSIDFLSRLAYSEHFDTRIQP